MATFPRWILLIALLFSAGATYASDADQAKAEIEKADAAFSALAQKIGVVPAARAYAAPDAVFLDVQPDVLRGPDAAALHMGGLPEGAVLTWKPGFAEASASGDFGYSRGTYALTIPVPNGPPATHTGHYLTIWKRQADGGWKMVFDTGEADSPPKK